tara:strand:+ start:7465 stop:7758 length:294 start_codon:yes stop_codon:yes gene_type:complete
MKISIILGPIFIFSCSKKPEDTFCPLCCSLVPPEHKIHISLVDELRDDLLDPANPKGIKIDDIMFWVLFTERKQVFPLKVIFLKIYQIQTKKIENIF